MSCLMLPFVGKATCNESLHLLLTMHMCKLDVRYQSTQVKTYTCMDKQSSPPMSKSLHTHTQVKMLVCMVRSPVMLVGRRERKTRTLTKSCVYNKEGKRKEAHQLQVAQPAL
jgi:hypothetical protein